MQSQELREIHSQLKANPSAELLTKAKLLLAELSLLVPSKPYDAGNLTLARDILEIGAYQSIRANQAAQFERYLTLISAFNLPGVLSPSPKDGELTSLALLHLLSKNQITEYHTLLEKVATRLGSDPHVAYARQIEEALMEGSYGKLATLTASQQSNPQVRWVLQGLIDTVREQIAQSQETAYTSIPQNLAPSLLFFNSIQEVDALASKRGWTKVGQSWTFPSASSKEKESQKEKYEIPRQSMMRNSLEWAGELESIV